MATVTLYVDLENFELLSSNKSFTAWNQMSVAEPIQINIPATAIGEISEHTYGIQFECFGKEKW